MNDKSHLKRLEHFGLYALIFNMQQVLLIKKKRGPYTGMYDLPGGRPEFDEDFYATLAREVYEETGLTLHKATQIKTALNISEFPDLMFRHVGILYLAEVSGELNSSGDDQDSAGAQWVQIEQINLSNCTPFVTEALQFLKNK